MVETKNPEEPTLPTKRQPGLSCGENEEQPNKVPKLQSLNNNSQPLEDKTHDPDKECVNSDAQGRNDEEEDDGDDDEGEDADGNGEVGVDRKGKGILIENEEEEDSSDDDDSSDGGSQSDGDSDLSDDPLAEVDLDNILPSRTRRRVIRPGEFVANDLDDDEDSDSDDGDA